MWMNSVNRNWAVGGWSPGKVKIFKLSLWAGVCWLLLMFVLMLLLLFVVVLVLFVAVVVVVVVLSP